MEVKKSHEQTDLGVIPSDWKVRKLGDVAHVATGNTPPTRDFSNYGEDFLFVSPADLGKGKYITNTEKKLSKKGFDISRRFPANSILFTCIGSTIGKSGISPKELTSNQQINAIFPDDSFSIDYLFYALNLLSPKIKSLAGEQAVPIINKSEFEETLIPLPPTKAEQTAIATALSDADALIQSLEKLIAKKRMIKRGTMQKMLNPLDKNGRLKTEWEVNKLDEISDVIDPHPSHRAPPVDKSGIPFVGIGDLSERGDIVNEKVRIVSESVFDEHKQRYDINDGLIGLGRVASIGKVVKLKSTLGKYLISPTLGVIKGKKASRDYLFYILNTNLISEQFTKIMSGSTRSSVGMIVLRRLDIPIPKDTDEQNRIATILADMDAEISALETKLAKYKQIKQGMMQNLLTGKIRLI